jgi:hypothetical protein
MTDTKSGHVRLKFDPNEGLPAGVPREMGFRLIEQRDGSYAYRAFDDASRHLVSQVQREGFDIDPQTLKITYVKNDWSGGFGAHRQRVGDNRPAFTRGVDHSHKHPILAPREYTMGVDAAQDALPERVTAFIEFDGTGSVLTYVAIYGRKVYKVDNWGTLGEAYLTEVFEHSDGAAILRDFVVYKDTLYVAAGPTAAYAYTTDGAAWTESNRVGDDAKADGWFVINNILHKNNVPNAHYQTTDGRNGATAWQGVDEIGDSSGDIQQMVGIDSNLYFAKDEGFGSLSRSANIDDLFPELQKVRNVGNGWHSFVWHKGMFYPTFFGGLYVFKEGRPYSVAPAHQIERTLETNPAYHGIFVGRIRAMTGSTDQLYAEMIRASDSRHRILMLQENAGGPPPFGYVWRTLMDLDTDVSDELFISSGSTSGPILMATMEAYRNYFIAYWTLPAGPDPLQDSRMRYTPSGVLYDPWLDMGCPTTPKRWDSVEIEAYAPSSTTIDVKAIGGDGSIGMNQTITVGPGTTTGILRFVKGFFAKRARFEYTLRTDDATETPALISVRIIAFALPPPVRMWEFSADAAGAGATWGAATQKAIRSFLDEMRQAQYPLLWTDLFQREWPVISIPPPPIETIPGLPAERIDEYWHIALIEQYHREFELDNPPEDEEEPPGEVPPVGPDETWPRLPSYRGRVFAMGTDSALAPVFMMTEDYGAPSPTWTALSVAGLPDPVVTDPVFFRSMWVRFNPWAHDALGLTQAVCLIHDTTTTWSLWVNTDVRNASATWTKILDKTIAETYHTPSLGANPFEIFYMLCPRFTIAEEGYLAVALTWQAEQGVPGTRESDRLVFHTHDMISAPTAPTWHVSNEITDGWYNDYVTDPVTPIEVGQHTSNRLYAYIVETGGGQLGHMHYRSDDGGHTFTFIRKEKDTLNVTADLFVPYENNPDDMICYAKGVNDLQTNWEKTTDGWASFFNPAVWPEQLVTSWREYPMAFDQLDSAKWVRSHIAGDQITKTDDDWQTETVTGSVEGASTRDCIAQVDEGWIFLREGQGGDAGGATHKLYFTADWVTVVEHTGDFNDIFAAGIPRALVPDFWQPQ